MGKVCVNCGKALNLFNETYPLWPDTDECFCSSCLNRLNTYFNREKASWQYFFEVKDMLNDHGFTPKGIEYI